MTNESTKPKWCYRGKPLAECSREELLEACEAAMGMYQDECRWNATQRGIWGAFQRTLLEQQTDLPPGAARVLRENLWDLYE